jgi:hypothetical protein
MELMHIRGKKETPATRIRCYKRNCRSVLVNVSLRMAEGMGQMTVQCYSLENLKLAAVLWNYISRAVT